ncbi:MAG: sigma factor-like helix-turn-helix DNA-binding protein [Polyangiales bacterium]
MTEKGTWTDPEDLDHAVRHAVSTALTEKQREAVEMFFFEGLSQSEIARRLGVSQQVIQKRLYGVSRRGVIVGGAVAKLREALAHLVRT